MERWNYRGEILIREDKEGGGGLSFLSNILPITLKVPKHEKLVTELFTLSDPIWIGDMRTKPKNPFV